MDYKKECCNGRRLIAYGVGNIYEYWKKTNILREFYFDGIADIKFEDGSVDIYDDTKIIHFKELECIRNSIIVVFSYNLEIYYDVKRKYENDGRKVSVVTVDGFFCKLFDKVGRELFYEIKTKEDYSDSSYYFIFRFHIGDTVTLFPFVYAFRVFYNAPEAFGIEGLKWWYKEKKVNKLIAIIPKRLEDLCGLCKEIDEIMMFSEFEAAAINYYVYNNRQFSNFMPDPNTAIAGGLSTLPMDMGYYAFLMYCLPINNNLINQYIADYKLYISEKIKKETDEYIHSKNLELDKMLVIAPQAQSTTMLTGNFWGKIVNAAKKNGMRVATNLGPTEKAINGTEELRISISLLLGLVAKGITIIGVQSGLMDVIRLSDHSPKKQIIILTVNTILDRMSAYSMGLLSERSDCIVREYDNSTYICYDENRSIEDTENDIITKLGNIINKIH